VPSTRRHRGRQPRRERHDAWWCDRGSEEPRVHLRGHRGRVVHGRRGPTVPSSVLGCSSGDRGQRPRRGYLPVRQHDDKPAAITHNAATSACTAAAVAAAAIQDPLAPAAASQAVRPHTHFQTGQDATADDLRVMQTIRKRRQRTTPTARASRGRLAVAVLHQWRGSGQERGGGVRNTGHGRRLGTRHPHRPGATRLAR